MKMIVMTCLLALGIFLAGASLVSQTGASAKAPEFNHVAIFVVDLQKSAAFYQTVIGLGKIPEPFHDGRHIWFRMGEHSQLHVVSGAKEVTPHEIDLHFSFRVASVPDFMARLDKAGVKFRSFKGDTKTTARPDGVTQIYFQDPDGYWIEVNDDKY